IDVQKKDVQEIMPQLNVLFNEKKEKQETKFYRGVEGIKTIFEDQIREGVDTFIIGASYNAEEILKFYMPHYTSKRIKKKIKLHLIYCGEKRAFSVPFGETRYLSKIYASPVSTNVYADKVAIIVWSDEPVAILIKNKSISNTYKNYFNLLWDVAEKKREKPAKTPESFEV
ncbi:MAG: hypothetical protein KKB65_06950, partial [Nanoarchaeota archaeon]|nr:hypothetical protein [Nanoarchaeota archaeon]